MRGKIKIDIFSHILPSKYLKALRQKTPPGFDLFRAAHWTKSSASALNEVDTRLRILDKYPDVMQVLTLVTPPVETLVGPSDAIELARIANDGLAELVSKYPDRFIAAVACLPLNDMDATLEEVDRTISQLGFKGVQIFTNINGEPLSSPRLRPLYEKMVQYDLPIWIHPWDEPGRPHVTVYGWPYETSVAMARLVSSGVLADYPEIKFITHHCGAMVPYFEQRIRWLPFNLEERRVTNQLDFFRKFYNDTAVYGSTPALMCAYAFFGADHILFGTDMPLGGLPHGLTQETIHSIEQMKVSDEDKRRIFEDNAIRLLRLNGS